MHKSPRRAGFDFGRRFVAALALSFRRSNVAGRALIVVGAWAAAAGLAPSAMAGSTVPVLTRCEVSAGTVDVADAPASVAFRLRVSCSRNWDTPPFWFGHRGNEFPYPENTMLAFRKVVEAGLRMIELDVCTTSDGVLVVFHDWHDVSRRTNGTGPVDGYTYEEIRQLDAGRYAGIQYAGEKVPSLEEVLRFALENEVVIMLNIKRANVDNIAALLERVGFPERLTWFLTDIDEDRDLVNGRFPTAMHIHWVGDKYKTPFEQTEESMAEHKAAGVDGYTFIDWGAEARWTAEEIDYIQARGILFGVNTPRAVLVPPYIERGADLFLIGNPAQAPLDLTPLAGGTLVLRGPGGEVVESAFDLSALVAGKPVLGEFLVPIELPAGLRPGPWVVGVTLVDQRGNRTAFGAGAGADPSVQPMPPGSTAVLQVENADYLPPAPLPHLIGHRVEPATVELRRAAGEVLVRVEGRDALTGVRRLRARLVSPDGMRQFDSGWHEGDGSGSADSRVALPPGVPRGDWSVFAHVEGPDGSGREIDLGRISVVNLDPYLAWAEGEFSALSDGALAEVANEEADLDRDGLPNLIEFAVGASAWIADPSAAGLRIVWGEPDELRFHARGGGVQIGAATYEVAAAELRYTIERFVPGPPEAGVGEGEVGEWIEAGDWIGEALPDLPPDSEGVAPGVVLRRVALAVPDGVSHVLLRLRVERLALP